MSNLIKIGVPVLIVAGAVFWGIAALVDYPPAKEPEIYLPHEPNSLTFSKDIAPIILNNCSVCHRPGESAPFDLLSYDNVRQHGEQIVEVTQSRFMPPWLPEADPGEFVGQRGLTVDQVGMIAQWADEGMQQGDPSHLPPTPQWTDGWQLGEPDLVVTMDETYTLPPDGTDVYRNFVISVPTSGRKLVKGVELRPGNPKVAHHARMAIDRTDVSSHLDQRDPEPGFDGMLLGEAKSPDGHFLGWTPGKIPTMAQDGMAWHLHEEADFVVQMHMLPSGKPETIQPSIGLFFTDVPPIRTPLMLRLGSKVIDIPAGKSNYTIEDEYTLPVDLSVLSIYPHAHYLCKEMQGNAELPDGTRKRLIHIKDWDFNWQDDYRFSQPVALPAGTTLTMKYVYDNSSDNVRNPNNPPRHILYGPQSYDEMGDLWIQVLPDQASDLRKLKHHFLRKDLAARIAGYEFRLEHNPDDYMIHNSLGIRLLSLGKADDALQHFSEAVRINPNYAKAHNNLGFLFQKKHKFMKARRHYRLAVEIAPDSYKAHNNLANVLLAQKQFLEAVRHYQIALRINPDYAKAHSNLSRVLKLLGRTEAAERHQQRARELEL